MAADSVTCSKCGKSFAATVVVCPFCGHRRTDVVPAVTPAMAAAALPRVTPLPAGPAAPGSRGTPLPVKRATPLPRGTPLPPGVTLAQCEKCKAPIRSETGICGRCGWDGARAQRACLKCGRLVTLNVRGLSLVGQGLGVLVVAAAGGYLLGVLGGVAAALGLAAVFALIRGFGVAYRCETCGQIVPPRYVSESERRTLHDRRSRYRSGTLVLTLLGVGAAIGWIVLRRS